MKFVGVSRRGGCDERTLHAPHSSHCGLFHRRGDSRGAMDTTEAGSSKYPKYLGLVPLVSTGTTVAMAACCMIPSASGWPALCHLDWPRDSGESPTPFSHPNFLLVGPEG